MKEVEFITREIESKIIIGKEPLAIPDGENPKTFILKTIQNFNDTLQPHEKARELVEILGENGVEVDYCVFTKSNTLTILDDNHLSFDLMKCSKCQIILKRMGLGQGFNIDFTVCRPDLVCVSCNKQFKSTSGMARHMEVGKHKIQHWAYRTK